MLYYPTDGILQDYQISYCGLIMGAGTPWDITPPADLLGLQGVRAMDQARVYGAGSWSGPDYADAITLSLPVELVVDDDTDFQTQLDRFMQAFGVKSIPQPLWVKVPGFPQYCIPCKIGKRPSPSDVTWGRYMSSTIEFHAPAPVKQGLPRSAFLQALPQWTVTDGPVGMQYPLFTNGTGQDAALYYGKLGSSSATAIIDVNGSGPTYPVATIHVNTDCTYLRITLGDVVQFEYPMHPGDELVLDWLTGSATLNGSDRSVNLTESGFAPVTVTTTATFGADGNATCDLAWADLWDGEGL